jgi:hypothetical protein
VRVLRMAVVRVAVALVACGALMVPEGHALSGYDNRHALEGHDQRDHHGKQADEPRTHGRILS